MKIVDYFPTISYIKFLIVGVVMDVIKLNIEKCFLVDFIDNEMFE